MIQCHLYVIFLSSYELLANWVLHCRQANKIINATIMGDNSSEDYVVTKQELSALGNGVHTCRLNGLFYYLSFFNTSVHNILLPIFLSIISLYTFTFNIIKGICKLLKAFFYYIGTFLFKLFITLF